MGVVAVDESPGHSDVIDISAAGGTEIGLSAWPRFLGAEALDVTIVR